VELDRVLEAKLGTDAPSVSNLRQAVYDCQVLAQQILEQKGLPPVEASEPVFEAGLEESQTEGSGTSRPAMNSRAQVFQTIAEAARVLKQLEPHSPVPFMLERAVELGALPFPELMKVLIRNPEVLTTLGRELGVKGMSEEL
jgi:type VI secretion system protein ImpA